MASVTLYLPAVEGKVPAGMVFQNPVRTQVPFCWLSRFIGIDCQQKDFAFKVGIAVTSTDFYLLLVFKMNWA